jgi:hypothetical protein
VVEAITGLQQIAVAQDPGSPASQDVSLLDGPLQQPSGIQAAEFDRATAVAPVREVNAAPAPSAPGLSGGVAHQMDMLASHLRGLDAAHEPSESTSFAKRPHTSETNGKEAMAEAVSRMERAYMFAIETTMASRGSTETTKIFNTLLKGQ